jgi:hypothetical protein
MESSPVRGLSDALINSSSDPEYQRKMAKVIRNDCRFSDCFVQNKNSLIETNKGDASEV